MRKLPLPAWYLPNGKKNALESELERASSSCEMWAIGCGAAVVIAVAAELIIAWCDPPYEKFLKLSIWPDIAIAMGIIGEVLFGMRDSSIQTELRTRSNDRLGAAEKEAAAANERSSEAQRETERLREAVSWRRLTMQQLNSIVISMREYREHPIGISIRHVGNDPESQRYAGDLAQAFIAAGLNVMQGGEFTPEAPVGLALSPMRGGDGSRFALVRSALENAGLTVLVDNPMDRIVLHVGSKPPPF